MTKFKNYAFNVALVAAFLMIGFLSAAFAAGAATGDGASPIGDGLSAIVDAFRGKDYDYAGALAIVFLVALARQYTAKIPGRAGAFLRTEWGALVLVVIAALAGSVAAQVAGPAGITMAVLSTAFGLAWKAATGYGFLKKFAYPILVKLRNRLPGWAQPIMDLLLWVLDGGAAKAAAKAKAAGEAAVAAKPGAGSAGVTGAPRDVP